MQNEELKKIKFQLTDPKKKYLKIFVFMLSISCIKIVLFSSSRLWPSLVCVEFQIRSPFQTRTKPNPLSFLATFTD
jgi:hypothetical protein